MSRQKRFGLSGIPHHVVQLGYNHEPAFFCADDYLCYKACLGNAALEQQCHIHAYALTPSQVHLLITPHRPHAIARLMQSIGRTYVQQINKRLNRIGTLWAGRYKASLIEPGAWLLRTQCYIEHLPVQLGLTQCAAEYHWSSYLAHAIGNTDHLIVDHSSYLELGADAAARMQVYCAMIAPQCDADFSHTIERALSRCAIVGGPVFEHAIADMIKRSLRPGHRGRPPKNKHSDTNPNLSRFNGLHPE